MRSPARGALDAYGLDLVFAEELDSVDIARCRFLIAVVAKLANRDVKDVLIVCCDGLIGFPKPSRRPGPKQRCRPASRT